jgi:polyphosphate kinase 2 (PPK2 family)
MAKKDKEKKLGKKAYEKELRKLQTELCYLQEYVKQEKLKVIVVFEGRDAAGKGGMIKRITARVSPRVFHPVTGRRPSGTRSVTSSSSPPVARS